MRFLKPLLAAALWAQAGCPYSALFRPPNSNSRSDSFVNRAQNAEVNGFPCDKKVVSQVGSVSIWELGDPPALIFRSGMNIDADGAPDAYHPDNTGRDYLANAGKPGNWWVLVTDNNRRDGNPVVQGPDDPAPGYYISTTALQDTSKRVSDPRRYVNSAEIPYIALPPRFGHGVALGDVVVVLNESSASIAFAIFADIGPPDSIGEGSIALASLLGVNPSP